MRRMNVALILLLCLVSTFTWADFPVSGTGGTGSVTSSLITDGTIVAGDIADNTITSAKLLDNTVASGKILDNTIASGKLLDNTIASGKILDNTIAGSKILDNTLTSTDIQDNTIAATDLASDIAIATTGYISGKVVVLVTGDNTTLTDAQAHGIIVFVSAERTITLPAVAAAGYSVCVQAVAAVAVDVDPDSSDGIRLNGSARDTNGDAIYSSGTAGDQICLVSDSASGWTTTGRSGTWAAR